MYLATFADLGDNGTSVSDGIDQSDSSVIGHLLGQGE